MRIAHITDLHYSSIENVYVFDRLFEALLDSLKEENAEKKIDLVFITGDLVDKGGKNLRVAKSNNHYTEIQEKVLDQIASALAITNDRIVIIPGNHDVCEKNDKDLYYLKGLRADLQIPSINKIVDENLTEWNNKEIDGLKTFKEFEKEFYSNSGTAESDIYHSNFETCFVYNFGKAKIGIAAFNSAWSCATTLDNTDKFKLAFGTSQIIRATNKFKESKTDFNIALLHHPINKKLFSAEEESEMKFYLSKGNFSMLFSGHTHDTTDNYIKEPDASYYLIVTKASLNNPERKESPYKSGFSLVDLSYASDNEIIVTRHFRKYVQTRRFDFDVDDAVRGKSTLELKLNYIGKNFIGYLKEQNKSFDSERKYLSEIVNSFSQSYIKSPFPEIIERALRESFERFLPKDSDFTYIRKDVKITWEISFHSENHYYFNEQQDFQLVSTRDPFAYSHSVFVDTILDGKDKTSLRFTKYSIDGKDVHTDFRITEEALPKEGNYGRERTRHKLLLNLKGKEQYHIQSRFEAVISAATKKAWSLTRRNIVDGYEITIIDPEDRYHIELFGMGSDFYYSNVDKKGNKMKQISVKHTDKLLAPGSEIWVFVSSYIPL